MQRLERLGDGAVQRARASESQLRVQRLLEERMREIIHDVGAVLALGQHVGAAKLVDRRDEAVVIDPARRFELVVRCPRSENRGDVRQPPRVRRQFGESRQYRVADRRRHAQLVDVPADPAPGRVAKLASLDQGADRSRR